MVSNSVTAWRRPKKLIESLEKHTSQVETLDVGMVKIEQRKDLGTEELWRQLDLVLPVRNGQHSPQINMDIPQISKNLKKCEISHWNSSIHLLAYYSSR